MAIAEKSKVTNIFTDIDLDFIPHPQSGDIRTLKDSDAVKRAIRNLMFTGKYERPFAPNIGANLKQLLFEPITQLTAISIKTYIQDSIKFYEPRATILNLQVNLDEDLLGYNVILTFAIDNTSQVSTVNVFLERLR